ncbi:DUF4240 domain-containing protein [Cognatiyoonia sp. IB215446]|uniref:DUF4240 domain-containing protein n=1 Tax=Cognatiyoonia sp. IB215446 TaxID=3097355 RepID=UPI002A0C1BE8|nr:DUF4240 domain-containing protein [Cognatiyoonia sp. IB215446]MDX8348023.1 DUF4240 domain-containing protein [Cognatiyoonia sp. IB215446]
MPDPQDIVLTGLVSIKNGVSTGRLRMLSTAITDLLDIEYKGLFEDQQHCFVLLSQKRDSGDADTPPELTQGPIFDLSPNLFIWVTQQHLANNSAHLVARDIMSNICTAGLSETYRKIVDMLADAGHEKSAAQIWRAGVATDIDVFRYFLGVKKAVDRYDGMSQAQQEKCSPRSVPDWGQRDMVKDFATKKQIAQDAVEAFEHWAAHYGVADQHSAQIALWKEELRTEKKPKLPPPDKTPMSEDLFWEIMARAQCDSEVETALKIEDEFLGYTGKAIRDAGKMMQSYLVAAYRADIWGLAYLLEDGCSDDAFEDFRGWMILRGRTTFETIMTSPDMFDPRDADGANFAAGGSLQSAFENAYLCRAGKPLILPRTKYPKVEFDEDRIVDLLPKMSARLASA